MLLFLLFLIFSSAIFAEEKATSKNGLLLLAERLLGKNAGDRLFYYLHGENDNVVPIGQGEILFKNAKGPKTLFKVEKGGHNNPLAMNDGAYQKKVLAWLDEVLK